MQPTSFGLGRRPGKDRVPYSREALRQGLLRLRIAWDKCQTSRERNTIYGYQSAVFDLVMWWAAEDRAISRARWALQLHGLDLPTTDEPFAAIILASADRTKVDKRTRSKWSRTLRYAAEYKTSSEPLAAFVQRKGGINPSTNVLTDLAVASVEGGDRIQMVQRTVDPAPRGSGRRHYSGSNRAAPPEVRCR